MDATRLIKENGERAVRRVESTPGLGLEPRPNAPEALVLPLHHPGIKYIVEKNATFINARRHKTKTSDIFMSEVF